MKRSISSSSNQHFKSQNSASSVKPSLFDSITTDFLNSHYRYAKQLPLTGINHIIIYHNSILSLLEKADDGRVKQIAEEATPALKVEYKFYKSLSHITVWLNIILNSILNNKQHTHSSQEELERIKSYLSSLKQSSNQCSNEEHGIICSLIMFIEQVIATFSMHHIAQMQKKYTAEIFHANERYAQRATELQLNGIHDIMNSWLNAYSLNLDATRILVVCAHGPKRNLIEIQYFINLFARYGLSDAEKVKEYVLPVTMLDEQISKVTQQQLVDFLRKFEVNRCVGEHMLGDAGAMTKDVLGKYAQRVLTKQTCPFHNPNSLSRFSHFAPKKKVVTEDTVLSLSDNHSLK